MDDRLKRNLAISMAELDFHKEALDGAQLEVTRVFQDPDHRNSAVMLHIRQFIALHGFYVLAREMVLGKVPLDVVELETEYRRYKAELTARAVIDKAKGDSHD